MCCIRIVEIGPPSCLVPDTVRDLILTSRISYTPPLLERRSLRSCLQLKFSSQGLTVQHPTSPLTTVGILRTIRAGLLHTLNGLVLCLQSCGEESGEEGGESPWKLLRPTEGCRVFLRCPPSFFIIVQIRAVLLSAQS